MALLLAVLVQLFWWTLCSGANATECPVVIVDQSQGADSGQVFLAISATCVSRLALSCNSHDWCESLDSPVKVFTEHQMSRNKKLTLPKVHTATRKCQKPAALTCAWFQALEICPRGQMTFKQESSSNDSSHSTQGQGVTPHRPIAMLSCAR